MAKSINRNKKLMTDFEKQRFKDYLAFFTTPNGADMLPYAYLEDTDNYNNLVKNNSDYYLFADERNVILSNQETLKNYLKDVTDIIEIGPGSDYTLEHKTLPILSCVENLKRYHAVDISKSILDNACNFVKKHKREVEICAIEADLMQDRKIELSQIHFGKKAIIFLGSTLGNFSKIQQNYVIKQISKFTETGDIIIITVDTNQDKESLLKAYDNYYLQRIVSNILKHFAKINPSFLSHTESFDVKCEWDDFNKHIEISFVARDNLSFHMENYGIISISEGHKFRGVWSRKPSQYTTSLLLNQNGFDVLDVLATLIK